MANDNRKPPHKHDPELARKEALKARQTRTHHSSQKESGHRQNTSRETTARPRTVLPHHAEKPSRKIPDISKYVVRK